MIVDMCYLEDTIWLFFILKMLKMQVMYIIVKF